MSQLRLLDFKYNLSKLRPGKERQQSDLVGPPNFYPDEKEIERVFYKIAGSYKNTITRKNLQHLLEKLGSADAERAAKRMIEVVGSKKDGTIDLNQFKEVHKNGVRISEIKRAFFAFDEDGDGRISAEEVKKMLERLGEDYSLEACQKMVKEVDSNHDGLVDMDDFVAMMTRPAKKT